MIKKPVRFWIVILLVGWLFDFLFWKHPVGINYAIYLFICLAAGLFLLLSNGFRPAKKSLLLLIPILFFTAVTFIRNEPLTVGLAYTFSLLSMAVFANTYLGGRWAMYSLPDYFLKPLSLLFSMLAAVPDFISQHKQILDERGEDEKKPLPVKPILRGLLIALPIVACFASLLASADVVFSDKLADIFDLKNGAENLFRLFLILIAADLIGGAYLHTAEKSKDEHLIGEETPVVKPFLGFTETTIVLSSVILLFLFFVIIQFQYFFGGNANIGVEGYTYSEYARKGFRELWIVSLLSLLLVIGFRLVTNLETTKHRRVYSGLSVAIVANVMVILTSSYQRLLLAIDWHSYSRLRLYPQVFIIWLGVLFLAVVVLEILNKERFFTLAALLASFGFAATLFFMNVDASIARVNIQRASELERLSVSYLVSQSTDVVPLLVEEFENPEYSEETHERIGAAIVCIMYTNRALTSVEEKDWRSYNYSIMRALDAYEGIQEDLAGYTFRPQGNDRVKTPSDNAIYCHIEQ